jgi:hypothetical protein
MNVISLILEVSYKNNKVFVDAMEHINTTQLEIEKQRNKVHKDQLWYLKSKNKKINLSSKNKLNVLVNLNAT